MRCYGIGVVLWISAMPAWGQGYSPAEAVKRMTLPAGFEVTCVASEPMIRQPLSLSFDACGRLWVLQYLQYPNPAGLKAVRQDQYLRTVWDKVPDPPPKGPRGADRITILSDPDDRGVFQKSRDFVTGLNLASGFCLGRGGVFVVQPPYLLYYADKNEDDIPDSDPDVLLSGFGMEDAHAYANSLQWGPDGWLYGAQGSTVTARIRNPARPNDPPIEFQQGIWRYHPDTKQFELFSEGGGNTFGLDFDANGQVIAGTNFGGFAMLHQMQGAYHVKGFAKHGPLHNPHTYGYFEHVPYRNFQGGHVTCGGIVYQGGEFPKEYDGQYIAGNLLSNVVNWHRIIPDRSSFRAEHGGEFLKANDTWFRPVDLTLGPDGSVYVADWTDQRASHLDPIDNWDRSNGRVYRIRYRSAKPIPPFDLRRQSTPELIQTLHHPNAWWRREARRLLSERREISTYPILKSKISLGIDRASLSPDDQRTGLEALWALYSSGGWNPDFGLTVLKRHKDPHTRAWALRLLGEVPADEKAMWDTLSEMAAKESNPIVLNQLAATLKRTDIRDPKKNSQQPLSLYAALILATRPDAIEDPQLPLMLWWAIERYQIDHADRMQLWLASQRERPDTLLLRFQLERIARRYAANDPPDWFSLTRLLSERTWNAAQLEVILRGLDAGVWRVPERDGTNFMGTLQKCRQEHPALAIWPRLMIRLHDEAEIKSALATVTNEKASDQRRIEAIQHLQRAQVAALEQTLITVIGSTNSERLLTAALGVLESGKDERIADTAMANYARWPGAVRKRAIGLLLARPAWTKRLIAALESQTIPANDVSAEMFRPALAWKDPAITAAVEKRFGKMQAATPGEKLARINWLSIAISRSGPGNTDTGKELFKKHCASCHQFRGEGGKLGPDLTTADRMNRTFMLTNIVDPSLTVRPEYLATIIETTDGRQITGMLKESTSESVTVVNVIDHQEKVTVIPRAQVESQRLSPVSLMPEKLLDTLTDNDVRDLLAFLASEPAK